MLKRKTHIFQKGIVGLILLFFNIPIHSQQIQHLGVSDGLSGRHTFNVAQDKKGFIWISTRFGVDRFDGYNIKNYPFEILNRNRPIRMTSVVLDRDTMIWAFTDRGTLYQYHEQYDRFINRYEVNNFIRSIYFDRNNTLWVNTKNAISFLQNDSIQTVNLNFQHPEEEIKQMRDFDNDHFLIVTTKNIYKFRLSDKDISRLSTLDFSEKINSNIESVYFDATLNTIWIGSVSKGLYKYDIEKNAVSSMDDRRLLYHPILCVNELDDNYLLLGTEGIGACLLNKKTLQLEKIYNYQNNDAEKISGNVVYDIYNDKDRRIYLSTYTDGVSILNFSETDFSFIKHDENNSNSLCSNVVCDILEDNEKKLWFATNKGLSFWIPSKNKWTRLLIDKNVLCLFEDTDGNIWAGTYSSGVYVFNKNGKLLHNYIKSDYSVKEIGTNFIYSITQDTEGNMWFGGLRGNMTRLNVKKNAYDFVPIFQVNFILPHNKEILVATESGVFHVNLSDLSTKPCAFNENLISRFVTDMHFQSDSVLWIGTYGGGINRCNLNTGSVQHFTTTEGLPSNIIHSFLPDADNNLWFCSENGIGFFNIYTHEVVNYSKTDGISGNQFRQLSRTKSSDGKFYFGSYEGVTFFDPSKVQRRKFSGKLFFQDFYIFNQRVNPENTHAPIKNSIDNTSSIKLNYKQHSFSFDFVSIDFAIREIRRYMWKLEGLDNDWVGPTKEHIANYTNINPGDYIFRVKYLDDSNNVINERELRIVVSPPFWNTLWAKTIFVIILLALAYFTYWYILQYMRKKQSEEKVKFFINTAHDLRTPLTLISAPIYELKEVISPTKRSEYLLNLVLVNLEKMNKMFSQLLDFQKAYELKDRLVIREYNVNQYLTEKFEIWRTVVESKERTLELVLTENEITEWFDEEKMDKILDNLISNALKYTEKKGKIVIQLRSDNNSWGIAIIDDGIGISKQDRKNLFTRFFRARNAVNSQISGSGLGLLLIKRYVSLHKGKITVNSVENKGSEFFVQFKHGNRHFHNEVVLDAFDMPVLDKQENRDEDDLHKLKIKVLIVEDNDSLRDYLKMSLSYYYHVFTSSNGEEAWEVIPDVNPDIVITDYQMPLMDGFELCEKIKKIFSTSHIPVIILTVINDKEHTKKGYSIGADDYIEKPFDIKYLRIKIDNIIQNRKILRQKYLGFDSVEVEKTENFLNDEFIKKATEIINNNINNPQFSVSDFSKEMGLSRSLLYTKFNTITGYSPNDFIKVIKMNRAIQYFKEKKHSINEVAFMVGFEEPSYFSACFKKIYGKSPKQFIDENMASMP